MLRAKNESLAAVLDRRESVMALEDEEGCQRMDIAIAAGYRLARLLAETPSVVRSAPRSVRFRDEVCHRDIAVAQRVLLGLREDILTQQEDALAEALALQDTVAAGERRLEEIHRCAAVAEGRAVTLSLDVLGAEEMCGRMDLVWNHTVRLVNMAAERPWT